MRNIIIRLSIGLISFSIIYLMISFVRLTIDFTQWSEEARFGFIIFGGFISLFSATAPYDTEDFNK